MRIGIGALLPGRDDLRPADHSWFDSVLKRFGISVGRWTRDGHFAP